MRIGKPVTTSDKSAQEILDEVSGWIEAQMDEITTKKD